MDLVSTSYRPEAKMVYNKLLKETKNLPDNVVNLADLIEVKGLKAQGNQMTKLKVKEIVLTHEIDGGELWPEDKKPEPIIGEDGVPFEIEGVDSDEDTSADIEWDLTKNPDDDEPQLDLFEEES